MKDDKFGLWVFLIMIGMLVWFGWLDDSRLRYSLQYESDNLTVNKKPSDCNFLRSPIGSKGCSYRKEVSVAEFSVDSFGAPIVTYDDGLTWQPSFLAPTSGREVTVFWVKEVE